MSYMGILSSNRSSAATMETWYVDPSFGGTSDGTNANPYKSLMDALTNKCNKTFTLPIQIICRTSSSVKDTTRVNTGTLGQMVTSSTNYLQVLTDGSNRAGPTWDTTKYNLTCDFDPGAGNGRGAGVSFANAHSYVYVDGLQISVGSVAGLDVTCEIVYTSEDSGNHTTCRYSNCAIKGIYDTGTGGQYTRCMSVIFGVNLWNVIMYGAGSAVGSSPLKNHGSSNIYSGTFIGDPSAITTCDFSNDGDGNGTSVIKNTYAGNASFHDYDFTAPASATMTTCGSSDSTATGTGAVTGKAVNTTQFTNVTHNSENWNLPGSSALKSPAGTDTSGSSAPFNFTTDIAGTSRGSSWSIGAVQA